MRKKMFLGAGAQIFKNAEALRYSMTPAEELLWGYLKGKQLGVKFRRQHPLGIYIADFYCHQHKLVIELDGGIHQQPETKINDIERQRILELNAKKVICFENELVFKQIDEFLKKIEQAISPPFRGSGGLAKRIIPC